MPVELVGGDRLAQGHEVGELNHLAAAAAHVDCRQIVRPTPIRVRDLDDDVILLGIAVEAGHGPAGEEGFQGTPHRVHAEPEVGNLLPVELDLELRRRQGQLAGHVRYARPALDRAHEALGDRG